MLKFIQDWLQSRQTARVFTNWADSYEADVTDNRYSAAAAVRAAILPLIGPRRRMTDLGIGTGLIWADMDLPEEMEVTGLDLSAAMLEQASAHTDLGPFYLCNVGRDAWPVADDSQDAIVAAGLFEYLTEPMADHAFAQARAVLKPDGLFIFTYIPAARNEAVIWRGQSGPVRSCRFAPEWIEGQAGFTVMRHDPAFAGSVFADGSSYDYRLVILRKTA